MRLYDESTEIDQLFEKINPAEFPFLEWSEKYIPFKITSGSSFNSFEAKFSIPGTYAPDDAGWNPSDPIVFTVHIVGNKPRGKEKLSLTVENVWDKSLDPLRILIKTSANVTYAQSFSSMSQANFKGNIVFLIYATVTKIITVYSDKYKPDVITFCCAHAGLRPVYYVLSMRAEKTFGFRFANPSHGRDTQSFYLVSPDCNRKLMSIFAAKTADSNQGVEI